jgi:hypothetical protein
VTSDPSRMEHSTIQEDPLTGCAKRFLERAVAESVE